MAQASSKFGIPLGTWRQYERGPSEPGSGALRGLADGGVNVHWLLTGEGEMLLINQNVSAHSAPLSPIDTETLAFVIESLESALSKRKLTLDAVRKANLIQLMYEYCMLDSANKQAGTVERFLKLVA